MRWLKWLAFFAFCLSLAAGAAAWKISRAPVNMWVETVPPSAAAYLNGRFVGHTPLALDGIGWGPGVLKLEHPDRAAHRASLWPAQMGNGRADRWRKALLGEPFLCRIELPLRQLGVLEITSDPPGAEAHVDGAWAGITPLRLAGLRPGLHTVRLVRPMYEEVSAEVPVEPDGTARLHRDLVPLILDILQARIVADPTNLHNYVDLAHEHIIRGHHEKAVPLMWKGHELLAEGKATAGFDDERLLIRFYYECFQVIQREFDFPEEGSLQIRQACYDILQAGRKAFPNEQYIANLVRRVRRP